MNRHHDFDAFWGESKKEPITFKALGEVFELPPEIPAAVILLTIRLHKDYGMGGTVPDFETTEIAQAMLGKANLEKLLAKGVTIPQLEDIIGGVQAMYAGEDPNPSTPELEPGEESPGITSSSTGAKSKAISKGSTRSG